MKTKIFSIFITVFLFFNFGCQDVVENDNYLLEGKWKMYYKNSNGTYESGIHDIHQDRGTIDGVYEFSNNKWITSHEIGGHVSYNYLICKNSNVFTWKVASSESSPDNCSCIEGDDFRSYEITFSDDGSRFYFSDCSQSNLPDKHTMGVKQ